MSDWTTQQAATYLGVTDRTIRNWINDGRLTWRSTRNPNTGRLTRLVNAREVIELEARMNRTDTRYH